MFDRRVKATATGFLIAFTHTYTRIIKVYFSPPLSNSPNLDKKNKILFYYQLPAMLRQEFLILSGY